MRAGEKLKSIRQDLGISARQVERYSRQIAEAEGSAKFYISNGWLSQIETTGPLPSIQKLYTLSVIYRINFVELLNLFGIDLDRIALRQIELHLPKTHLARLEVYNEHKTINYPVRLRKGFRLDKTTLLPSMVRIWGEVPISVIRHLDIRHSLYGYIGLRDNTMDPLIPAGSFVQIDNCVREILPASSWRTEFDRPVYFVRIPGGYSCSWCERKGDQLTLVPHPLSRSRLRHFAYDREAKIIGRVTGIAMRIVRPEGRPAGTSAKRPNQS